MTVTETSAEGRGVEVMVTVGLEVAEAVGLEVAVEVPVDVGVPAGVEVPVLVGVAVTVGETTLVEVGVVVEEETVVKVSVGDGLLGFKGLLLLLLGQPARAVSPTAAMGSRIRVLKFFMIPPETMQGN